MAMRMSGLISGMDTESLIGQLVEARSTKVNKAKKAQTKLEWQQDAWKDLNKKLKNLQSKFINNMRFSTAYSKKTTKVSNPNAVSVITGEDAVNGVQSLEVNQMAKTAYMTGGELKDVATNTRGNYTAMSTLSELGFSGTGTFRVEAGNTRVDVEVNANTTISDVLNKIKDAGLNATFDARNQRFFISAKESGAAADFSISAKDSGGTAALKALGLQTSVTAESDSATFNQYSKYVKKEGNSYAAKDVEDLGTEVANEAAFMADQELARYKSLQETKTAAEARNTDIENRLNGADGINQKLTALRSEISGMEEGDEKAAKQAEYDALDTERINLEGMITSQTDLDNLESQINTINSRINITTDADGTMRATPGDLVTADAKIRVRDMADAAAAALNAGASSNGATKINGQDAKIRLNGAEFTSSSNTFEINGLTLTALAETQPGESITITTEQDTDGIYDMVKNFLKEYNSIINEMDKLYNADSAKGYEPLTDDEKKALSDSEVEKYEKKIKDALLRRDKNLSDISSGLREIMSGGVEVNGKTLHLFDFGIDMLGYFNAAENERNAYHIDGDPDDADTSGNADKLKSLIASDPDTVISFFTKLSQNLYAKMTDMSKSVDGYRSFGSFYDDKKMKSDYDSYKSKIADLEEKLNKYEDSWYKKFAKMESTMAKMQKNTSALTGLLGGNS